MNRSLLMLPSLALAFFACNPKEENNPPEENIAGLSLIAMNSCDDVKEYLAESTTEYMVQSRYGYYWYGEDDLAGGEEGAPATDGDSGGDNGGGGGPKDYTGTNNQEEGVDELDIVKTDGNYLYIAQERSFSIVESFPADQTSLVSQVALDGYVSGLYIDGDTALVMSNSYNYSDDFENGSTTMTVFDITDRTAPKKLRTIDVEGYLSSARRIDSDVYAVVNTYTGFPYELWNLVYDGNLGLPEVDYDATEEERDAAKEEARKIMRPLVDAYFAAADITKLLPALRNQEEGAEAAAVEPLLDCGSLYHPQQISYPSVLSVVHVNLEDEAKEVTATGLFAEGWTVYASAKNLYVAQGSNVWWDYDGGAATQVHQFSISPEDGADYEASLEVPGWLNNQFAMSEFGGYFRIATTEFDWWGWGQTEADQEDQGANLFVLERDGNHFNQVGSVEGLAPGEQIYATRMLGNTAYVVTFRQVDPLFTIDLTDPTAPKVRGELKIPGYSAYLHPMDADHLLAVGMDGTEEGQVTGLAVSVFDVSDLDNPQQVQKWTLGSAENAWSYSEALWDHHAFTYRDGVLTIPIYQDQSTVDELGNWSWGYFSGAVVLDVGADGISERGRVDHADLVLESDCSQWYWGYGWEDTEGGDVDSDTESEPSGGSSSGSEGDEGQDTGGGGAAEPPTDPDEPKEEPSGPVDCISYGYYYAQMRRSVYIDDSLYTISNYGVKVNELSDPSVEQASVVFYPVGESEPEPTEPTEPAPAN